MKKYGAVFCLVMYSISLIGCATPRGPKINDQAISHIKEGKTTKSEIMALFGKPMTIDRTQGGETYLYETVLSKPPLPPKCQIGFMLLYGFFMPSCYKDNSRSDITRLSVTFDDAQTVTDFNKDELQYYGAYFQNAAEANAASQAAAQAAARNASKQHHYQYK